MPSLQAVEIPADVLARARAGNVLAQESIYRELSKPVYTLIRRLVVRPAIAEELLQDVFVEVLRNLPKYSGVGSFLGWVRSIAVSKALMYLRSPWHRSLSWLGDAEMLTLHEQALAARDEALDADLERALAHLHPISRAVVWLYDVEGLTHAEIARHFGRTVSFSKSQLARAHEALREGLESKSGDMECTPISKHS